LLLKKQFYIFLRFRNSIVENISIINTYNQSFTSKWTKKPYFELTLTFTNNVKNKHLKIKIEIKATKRITLTFQTKLVDSLAIEDKLAKKTCQGQSDLMMSNNQ
jgi:hypothetical protein